MTDATRHPDIDIMTAFIDGQLDPAGIAEVSAHLRGCAGCRTIVSETAALERESRRAARPRSQRRSWLAAAAALVVIAGAVPLLRYSEQRRSPIARLIAASPSDHRIIAARVSGFRWARPQPPPRGANPPPDPGDMKLTGAAGEVLDETAGAQTPQELHARGVAYLMSKRPDEAVAALQQAAGSSSDAKVWSDLAAARLAGAEAHASQLPAALAAADRALQLDPKLAEARFNRALILETMGLREEARKAWEHYLEIDGAGQWSNEAREHLRRLSGAVAAFDPKSFQTMPPESVARQFPQQARMWGEGPLLADWADAVAKGDAALAQRKLDLCRSLGANLARLEGEWLLAGAVAAIDGASADARAALAGAHRVYRDARLAYQRRELAVAEAAFGRAAEEFAQAGSPMESVARYYVAQTVFDQNRGEEARRELTRLLASIDRSRHRALAAQLQWELAVAANADGDFGTGLRWAEASAEAFRALGEELNAAWLDDVAAQSLDMIGANDLAWSRRAAVFPALAHDPAKFGAALHGAVLSLLSAGRNDEAEAVSAVLIDVAGNGDPSRLASALASHAQIEERRGDAAALSKSVADGRAAAGRVKDAALRAEILAELDLADAARTRLREPRAAAAALGRSIALFGGGGLRNLLPRAYLERGRAYAAAGDDAAAAADYAAALAEVDRERGTITSADLQLRFLDLAAQIVDDAVALHLAHGRASEALRIVDQTHALVAGARPVPRLPPGVVAIEYALLPHAVALFAVTADVVSAKTVAVDRARLRERIAAFTEAIRRRAPLQEIERQGAELHALLIAPHQAALASAERLIIVPDRDLSAVPFAALYDARRKQYLAEQVVLQVAPSVPAPGADETATAPALVVADPPAPNRPRLPDSAREAEKIAASYRAALLEGEAATRERFLAAAPESALIHFAGHADSDSADSYASLQLAASGSDPGILGSSEIARLVLPRHPLVVLAACGTFRGRAHLAGMPSVARAFLLAGARGVVGTLWEIDDDVAAALFPLVHEHLRAGASPARAVQAAQIAMIHAPDPRLRHPATWALVELLRNRS